MSILLDASLIQRHVSNDIDITVLRETSSTNDFFMDKIFDDKKRMHCCLAEQQTRGRGRGDHVWHSPFAQNIYLSYCYFSNKSLQELSSLSAVIGLAAVEALKSFGFSRELKVKWPNDILFNRKKLAGILIETQEKNKVIIGIGLNVNMTMDEEIKINQPWTSLLYETGKVFDRNSIVIALIQQLWAYIQRFEASDPSVFVGEGFFL